MNHFYQKMFMFCLLGFKYYSACVWLLNLITIQHAVKEKAVFFSAFGLLFFFLLFF